MSNPWLSSVISVGIPLITTFIVRSSGRLKVGKDGIHGCEGFFYTDLKVSVDEIWMETLSS